MSGPLSISLSISPSELQALKGRVVTGQATPDDILKLVLEIESLQSQFKTLADTLELYKKLANKINEECYKSNPSQAKISDWSDELRYGLGLPNGTVERMEHLLASVLHHVDVTGALPKEDKLVLNIRRLLYDADLMKRG